MHHVGSIPPHFRPLSAAASVYSKASASAGQAVAQPVLILLTEGKSSAPRMPGLTIVYVWVQWLGYLHCWWLHRVHKRSERGIMETTGSLVPGCTHHPNKSGLSTGIIFPFSRTETGVKSAEHDDGAVRRAASAAKNVIPSPW